MKSENDSEERKDIFRDSDASKKPHRGVPMQLRERPAPKSGRSANVELQWTKSRKSEDSPDRPPQPASPLPWRGSLASREAANPERKTQDRRGSRPLQRKSYGALSPPRFGLQQRLNRRESQSPAKSTQHLQLSVRSALSLDLSSQSPPTKELRKSRGQRARTRGPDCCSRWRQNWGFPWPGESFGGEKSGAIGVFGSTRRAVPSRLAAAAPEARGVRVPSRTSTSGRLPSGGARRGDRTPAESPGNYLQPRLPFRLPWSAFRGPAADGTPRFSPWHCPREATVGETRGAAWSHRGSSRPGPASRVWRGPLRRGRTQVLSTSQSSASSRTPAACWSLPGRKSSLRSPPKTQTRLCLERGLLLPRRGEPRLCCRRSEAPRSRGGAERGTTRALPLSLGG